MALIEEIIQLLERQDGLTAREICSALDIDPKRERDVYEALQKAARVLKRKGRVLLMQPPRCRKCGFEAEKPRVSRCPRCKSERIEEARFFLEEP